MRRPLSRAPWVGCVWSALSAVALVTSILGGGGDAEAQSKSKKVKKRVEKVSACVDFRQDGGDGSVDFHFVSSCARALDCGVTWTLQCETWEGKRSARSHDGAAFVLEPDASHVATASASSCGDDGWVIDDVSWSCTPPKQ